MRPEGNSLNRSLDSMMQQFQLSVTMYIYIYNMVITYISVIMYIMFDIVNNAEIKTATLMTFQIMTRLSYRSP